MKSMFRFLFVAALMVTSPAFAGSTWWISEVGQQQPVESSTQSSDKTATATSQKQTEARVETSSWLDSLLTAFGLSTSK